VPKIPAFEQLQLAGLSGSNLHETRFPGGLSNGRQTIENDRGRLDKICDNSNQRPMSSKPALRTLLAESHVADVAILVLLFRSLAEGIRVIGPPLKHASAFVFTAIAIRDIPYYELGLSPSERMELVQFLAHLISCLVAAASAWILSRWVYQVGPVRSLSERFKTLPRSSHV
jgi:hypothetical protein